MVKRNYNIEDLTSLFDWIFLCTVYVVVAMFAILFQDIIANVFEDLFSEITLKQDVTKNLSILLSVLQEGIIVF